MSDPAENTAPYTIEVDGGVVVLRWTPGVVITGSLAAEAMAATDRLNGDRRRPLLVDMSGTDTLTREGRETFRGDVQVTCLALVGRSAVDRVIANFGLRVSSLPFPARFFTSVSTGMSWLREHG